MRNENVVHIRKAPSQIILPKWCTFYFGKPTGEQIAYWRIKSVLLKRSQILAKEGAPDKSLIKVSEYYI